jgi:8-oxo-dGTP diphosphatase
VVTPDPRHLTIIIDVANAMGARADGWWKDRAGAARRLCEEVAALAARGLTADDLPAEVPAAVLDEDDPAWVLVLEGRAREAVASLALEGSGSAQAAAPGSAPHQILAGSGGLARVVLAPGSGDDTITREVCDLQGCRIVTTADRELRRRCEQAGAIVTGPRWLLRLL